MWSETFRNVLEGASCRPNQQCLFSNDPILGTPLTHAYPRCGWRRPCTQKLSRTSTQERSTAGGPGDLTKSAGKNAQEAPQKKPTQCLSMCCGRLPTLFFERDNLCRVLLRWPQADTLHRARGLVVRGGGVLLPRFASSLGSDTFSCWSVPENMTYTSQCVRYRFNPFFLSDFRVIKETSEGHWWRRSPWRFEVGLCRSFF